MKQTTKNTLRDKFLAQLEKDHQNLSENQRWKIANDLADSALDIIHLQVEELSRMYNANALELEQHKKQFRDHIEFVELRAKTLINDFRYNGFMKVENDRNGKAKLVGRTTMVTDMVNFLNALNERVMKFYKEVYKIEGNSSQEFDVKQTSLF